MKPEYITLTQECIQKLRISGFTLIDSVKLREKYGIELFESISSHCGTEKYIFKILNLGVFTFAKIKYGF